VLTEVAKENWSFGNGVANTLTRAVPVSIRQADLRCRRARYRFAYTTRRAGWPWLADQDWDGPVHVASTLSAIASTTARAPGLVSTLRDSSGVIQPTPNRFAENSQTR